MKFTRFHLVRAINNSSEDLDESSQLYREVLLAAPYMDCNISLVFSIIIILYTETGGLDKLLYLSSVNPLLVVYLNSTIVLIYILIDYAESNKFFEGTYKFTITSITKVIKILLLMESYFFSLFFFILYSNTSNQVQDASIFSRMFLQFFSFYSGFRFFYFLFAITINIYFISLYVSTIILSFIEDRQNHSLNDFIKTKAYCEGDRAVIRKSQVQDYCIICLNSFIEGELTSSLPCSKTHTFHTFCLERWFVKAISCPLCRTDYQSHLQIGNIFQRPNQNIELQEML